MVTLIQLSLYYECDSVSSVGVAFPSVGVIPFTILTGRYYVNTMKVR